MDNDVGEVKSGLKTLIKGRLRSTKVPLFNRAECNYNYGIEVCESSNEYLSMEYMEYD